MSDPWTRLESLLEAEGRPLYALLVRLTLREDVADDLLQELVVRLSQSDGFRRADDSLRYARRAAIHLAFDWHRRKKRLGKIEVLLDEPAAAAASSLNALIAREDHERINVVGPDGKPVTGAKILVAIWSKERTAKTNQEYVSDVHGQTMIKLPKSFDILRLFTRCDGYVPLFTHWEQLDENPPDARAIAPYWVIWYR